MLRVVFLYAETFHLVDTTREPMHSVELFFNWTVDPLLKFIFPLEGPFDLSIAILIIALLILQNIVSWLLFR